MTREKHGVLTIHHEPLGVYRQGKRAFFIDRARAYALIARTLPDGIHTVQSASFWLDYNREGWRVETLRSTPLKRLAAAWFYWTNMTNWHSEEPGSSWYAIGHPTYQLAMMTREQFIARFGGEGEDHFTPRDGLDRLNCTF